MIVILLFTCTNIAPNDPITAEKTQTSPTSHLQSQSQTRVVLVASIYWNRWWSPPGLEHAHLVLAGTACCHVVDVEEDMAFVLEVTRENPKAKTARS